ncbi:MAG: T9SS type A sorting domain-containing protein, partial [Candidatus Latescibacteria bacterium]|nr:T9SS type A sorting domain-containing protein [Candidatus Latescibacterota bacterium]
VDATTGIITTVAGRIRGFWGDGGPAADARFWSPEAICLDRAGNLYIADANNHRVRMVEGLAAPSPITVVAEEDLAPNPQHFALDQNYPNPFNTSTLIRVRVPLSPDPPVLRLAIYNLAGQRIRLLAEDPFNAGERQLAWDGRDGAGRETASGVYIYRLESKGLAVTRRMLLLR